MNSREKGRLGEQVAEDYLKKNNYKLLDKNYYTRWGEIDIVAEDRKTGEFVFVEVKMRNTKTCGYPEEAVTENKLEKMEMAAEIYRQENKEIDCYRFDCLAVEGSRDNEKIRIKHYKNIGLN